MKKILLGCLIGLVFGVIFGAVLRDWYFNYTPDNPRLLGWSAYTSEDGYTFDIPPGIEVITKKRAEQEEYSDWMLGDFYVELAEKQADGNYFPGMVMHITPADHFVAFGLWEGLPWENFDGVLSSFRFTRPPAPSHPD